MDDITLKSELIDSDGNIIYKKVYEGGGRIIYRNSKNQYHRVGGPAYIWENGDCSWWQNGRLHREDGPSMEFELLEDDIVYHIEGKKLSKEEFHKQMVKRRSEKLKSS